MDFLPILVLLLFVVLGGFIAVVADNVGRKLGKKRLKFGKLRPKHTAMLGTFVVGALISLFTIVFITIASSDVRRWITEGNRAVRQLQESRRELQSLENDLDGQRKEYDKLNKDYRAKAAEVNKQAAHLARLQKQIGGLEPQIDKLTAEVTKSNRRIKDIERQKASAERELQARQKQLGEAQQELARVEGERKRQEALAKAAADQANVNAKRNQELTVENQRLENEIDSLRAETSRLKTDIGNLEDARNNAQEDLNSAQQQLREYQTDLLQAQRDLNEARTQFQRMQSSAQMFAGLAGPARFESMSYQIGEEVARATAAGGLSLNQAEDVLTSLLRTARLEAIGRGAKPSERAPEAGLIPQADQVTGEPVPVETVQRRIVQKIAASADPVVLVAYSGMNAFRGEPVFLDIEVLPNPQVYAKGQVIAEARVDGSKDEAAILKQLEDLFTVRIRERAKQDKMIPKMGSEQFGEVTPADIYRLLSQVKAADREVRVQALALADTRAGDPLRLDFRIR